MNPILEHLQLETRRYFFGRMASGLGAAALGSLLNPQLFAAEAAADPLKTFGEASLKTLHFAPKAKRIIWLFMADGPSQLDLYDHKPKMPEYFDKDLPDSIRNGQRITTMTSGQARFPVAPSMFKFDQHGECGRWVSELLPHTAKCVDDLCLVKTVHTNAINHDPACTFVMTGSEVPGKPSLGSWLAYGLGSERNDLPAFVVLTPTWSSRAAAQALFTRMWSSGFLPGKY